MFYLSPVDFGTFLINRSVSLQYKQIYVGTDQDAGYYVWKPFPGSTNYTWIWTNQLFPKLKLQNIAENLEPRLSLVNGYIYWVDTGNNFYCYYLNSSSCFILIQNKYPGYQPKYWEYEDEDETRLAGDVWYEFDLPNINETSTATKKGAVDSETTHTVTFEWDYWSRSDSYNKKYGIYTATHGVSGTKKFGCPRWQYQGEYWQKSLTKDNNGYYKYIAQGTNSLGDITYNTSVSKWILGTYNNPTGWHESTDELSEDNSVTFSFNKPQNSSATGTDFNIALSDYKGYEFEKRLVGDVVKWL